MAKRFLSIISLITFFSSASYANICDRTEGVYKAIEYALDKSCGRISDNELKNYDGHLVILHMGNKLEGLNAEDFKGLSNLRGLTFWDNYYLTSLPDNLLKYLSSLEKFYISGDNIERLSMGLFKDSTTLKEIQISRLRNLQKIPANILQWSMNLEVFILSSTAIQKLPQLGTVENLRRVDFSSNELKQLPENIFSNNKRLAYISLDNNSFEALREELFIGLTEVEILLLSDNKLKYLPNGLFDNMAKLTHLYLNSNELVSLPLELFKDLNALKLLNLYENNLSWEDKERIRQRFPHDTQIWF